MLPSNPIDTLNVTIEWTLRGDDYFFYRSEDDFQLNITTFRHSTHRPILMLEHCYTGGSHNLARHWDLTLYEAEAILTDLGVVSFWRTGHFVK